MIKLAEEQIAEIAHEANRTFRRMIGEEPGPSWEDTPNHLRESTIAGVRTVEDDPYRTARQMHASWMQYKLNAGWKWGEVKDDVALTHPNICLYDQLPEEQRRKDLLFLGIVQAFVLTDV